MAQRPTEECTRELCLIVHCVFKLCSYRHGKIKIIIAYAPNISTVEVVVW